MPNIHIRVPEGVFDEAALAEIARGVTAAAKTAEQIPDDPRMEFLCWIAIEEVQAGHLFAGGADPTGRTVPIMVQYFVPAGVLDEGARAVAVKRVHDTLAQATAMRGPRVPATSVMVIDVPDGHWAANGALWSLRDFARASGYRHLQHLVG